MNEIGYYIKNLRLDRKFSLIELSDGICDVSYLSKIENNLVKANEEILEQLFRRLDVDYDSLHDEKLELKQLIEQYFSDLSFDIDREIIYQEIMKKHKQYQNSQYIVSFYLCTLFGTDSILDISYNESKKEMISKIRKFINSSNERECRYIYIYLAIISEYKEDKVLYLKNAKKLKYCSLIQYLEADICFHEGNYLTSIEKLLNCYNSASLEGNIAMMYQASILIGNSYSNLEEGRNIMVSYYERALNIGKYIKKESFQEVNYNIGATYLEKMKINEAYLYLSKLENHNFKTPVRNFLLYHKLAYLYFEMKRLDKANYFVNLLVQILEQLDDSKRLVGEKIIAVLTIMVKDTDYINNETYSLALKFVFDNVENDFHVGLKRFYIKYIKELYISQRRYKELVMLND